LFFGKGNTIIKVSFNFTIGVAFTFSPTPAGTHKIFFLKTTGCPNVNSLLWAYKIVSFGKVKTSVKIFWGIAVSKTFIFTGAVTKFGNRKSDVGRLGRSC